MNLIYTPEFKSLMTHFQLPNIPTELLLEIINHIPDLPFPFTPRPRSASSVFFQGPISHNDLRVQKTSTLRALSQTCRNLREFARPLAWEAIEAVSVRKLDPEEVHRLRYWVAKSERRHLEYPRQLSRDLRRQLRVVLEDDNLRKNLRRASVIITESSIQAILDLFKAFRHFPKLQTIQLFSLSGGRTRRWEETLFSSLNNLNTPLRSVKNVDISKHAKGLLRHCPALEVASFALQPYSNRDVGRDLLKEISDHCPSVKHFRGLPIRSATDVELLVKSCPQLVSLCIDNSSTYIYFAADENELRKPVFQGLSALNQLRHITLIVDGSGSFERHQIRLSIMRCIMILGGVSDAKLGEYQMESNVDPFDSPFPADLLPTWFLKKIAPCEIASSQENNTYLKLQDRGTPRTLTVDISGLKRPVAILSIAPAANGKTWPRLLRMQVGFRSDDALAEFANLTDIPLTSIDSLASCQIEI